MEREQLVRPWWRTEAFVLATVVATLVLVGLIVFSLGSDDEPDRPLIVDAATAATTAPAAVAAPESSSQVADAESELPVAEASASSVLEPDGNVTYEPERTLDGEPATAWNDGVDGDPAGAWLEYTFASPVRIARIEIVNGYDKTVDDLDLFDANARVRDVTIETDESSTDVQLDDSREPQSIDGPDEPACRVRLLIDSVYEGTRFEDVAVSEIMFIGTDDADGSCAN